MQSYNERILATALNTKKISILMSMVPFITSPTVELKVNKWKRGFNLEDQAALGKKDRRQRTSGYDDERGK